MKDNRFNRARCLTMFVLCAVAAAGQAAPPPSKKTPVDKRVPKELADYHDRLVEVMREMRVPGLAVAVVKDDEVVFVDTLGVRNPETKEPVTPDTIFYIASCTKTFIATAIVSLAEEGKIDLDAPVKRYLPRFELADAKSTEA